MRVSVFRLRVVAGLALLAPVMAGLCGEPSKAPEASKPTPKSTPSATTPSGLKKLEGDLFKPFQSLSPESSLDAVLTQPLRPVAPVPSKRARESEDRRKNWILLDPDEMLKGPLEESLGTSDADKMGNERSKMSPMEKYLDRNNGKTAKTIKKSIQDDPFKSRNPFDTRRDVNDENGLESSDLTGTPGRMDSVFGRELRSATAPAVGARPRSTFADVFGLATSEPSTKEKEMDKARLDAFKDLLGGSVRQETLGSSLSPVSGVNDLARKPVAVPSLPSVTRSSSFDGQFGTVQGLPNVGTLEDKNTKTFTVPGVTPALPKTEAPKSYFTTPPTFTAPKRSF